MKTTLRVWGVILASLVFAAALLLLPSKVSAQAKPPVGGGSGIPVTASSVTTAGAVTAGSVSATAAVTGGSLGTAGAAVANTLTVDGGITVVNRNVVIQDGGVNITNGSILLTDGGFTLAKNLSVGDFGAGLWDYWDSDGNTLRAGGGDGGVNLKVINWADGTQQTTAPTGTASIVKCLAYNTATAGSFGSSVFTTINFGTKVGTNDFGDSSMSSGVFTVPAGQAGRYIVSAVALGVNSGTGTTSIIAIYVNSTEVKRGNREVSSSGQIPGHVASAIVAVADADTITARLYSSAAMGLETNAYENRIDICRIQ